MRRLALFIALMGLIVTAASADKIIMKDGKIYEGHIMGETHRSILISNPPLDPKPRFLDLRQVMTIVRDRPLERIPSLDEQRFATLSVGAGAAMHQSTTFSFSPSSTLYFGGGFRIHPSVELGGELLYTPSLTGTGLTVSDGTHIRGYESFYAFEGGFSVKGFPFYRHRERRWEPYLTTGYHWSRLVPKASGDELRGHGLFGGLGIQIAWWKPLYWDLRFTYTHTTYDAIQFLGGEGTLSNVTNNTYGLSAGLSYRFL